MERPVQVERIRFNKQQRNQIQGDRTISISTDLLQPLWTAQFLRILEGEKGPGTRGLVRHRTIIIYGRNGGLSHSYKDRVPVRVGARCIIPCLSGLYVDGILVTL